MHILAWLRTLCVAVAFLLLMPCVVAQSNLATPTIVITHVTVINPGSPSARSNQDLLVTGEYISAVVEATKYVPRKDAQVIGATGQYLIPVLGHRHGHSAFGHWFRGRRDGCLP